MMHAPKVSVIMPVYNGQTFLAEAIESILHQTFTDFELLIVNDGSTDNSLAIVRNFTDNRIRVIENPENQGLVITRNKAIAAAQGQYLAMLDCDDIALPNRLGLQNNFLDAHPEYGLVGSQVEIINNKGQVIGKNKYQATPDQLPVILFFHNYVAQSAVMVRRTCLEQVQYRPEFPSAEDYDLWVRLARLTKFYIIPRVLVQYRQHSQNISLTKAEIMATAKLKIMLSQLSKLGIQPSAAEIKLHQHLAQYSFIKSKLFVRDCAHWLLKLDLANQQAQCFPNQDFREQLVHRFRLVCGNSGLGWWGLQEFFKFPLLKYTNFNAAETAKLFFKLISRRK